MITTSGDLLNLILALSIAVFTGFLCWFLYTITIILRRISGVITEIQHVVETVKEKIDRFEKLFNTIEEKVKGFSSVMPLVLSGINAILDFIKKRKNSSKKKSTD
jgi:hypothetical protein